MSHEIRTPLNAVIGMSHLAAQVNTAPRVTHYLQRIRSSSQHLLGIVSDILDLSKIEAGKLPIEAIEFSLERMLEHVAGLVWERADAKGLELIIAIEPTLPERLLGDSMRLGQILINFANNAVKFTDSGEVVLRVRQLARDNGTVRLSFEVEDTGIGIPEEKLPLLFTPFQQLDGTMARRFEGTGLGLAISKSLAELMEGEVSVTSQLGHGSIFSLDISLRIASSASCCDDDLRPIHAIEWHWSSTTMRAPAVNWRRSCAHALSESTRPETDRKRSTASPMLTHAIAATTSCSSTARCRGWTAGRPPRRSGFSPCAGRSRGWC